MVNPGKALGRALIGSLFIYGGRNALVNRQHLTGLIDNAQEKYGVKEKVPATSEQLIQANGAGMVALGSTLALGIKPNLSAIGLLGMIEALGRPEVITHEPGPDAVRWEGWMLNGVA